MIPVDRAAGALKRLLPAPRLEHNRDHIPAGPELAIRCTEQAEEPARLNGGEARDRQETGTMSQLTHQRNSKALGRA